MIFFDLEVNVKSNLIDDFGAVKNDGSKIHTTNAKEFSDFISGASFFVGHNVINHDFKFFENYHQFKKLRPKDAIDTLFLSTLLFPEEPYHKLVKDYKLQTEDLNNPLNDSIIVRVLFGDILEAFKELDENMKKIYYELLNDVDGFAAFFKFIKYKPRFLNVIKIITEEFKDNICENAHLSHYIKNYPVELSYALAIISTKKNTSVLPSWVLKNYPMVETILWNLRNVSCDGCSYCDNYISPTKGLKKYFDYDSFRKFEGVSLQEDAVIAGLKNESIITIFPTGGGKSLAFQLPALMINRNVRGLTVVISPLQSLMKDQVDSLIEKGVHSAVTINGLLNSIEKQKAFEQVRNGNASILYIAPESLRSRSIQSLLLSRQVVRFVIDEAHCFSTWGHDFRVDYQYIGDYIKEFQEIKQLKEPIPVSCFTATAKKQVIEDIEKYFKEKLDLTMKVIQAPAVRKNLTYEVIKLEKEAEKYQKLREIIGESNVPTIIYASTTKIVDDLYLKLKREGLLVSKFHGKMEKGDKIFEQNKFMSGETQIMVATNAFGMGVDKDNIKKIIHYNISDSLENYIQEAGRAGRKADINAICYILFTDDDLNRHFRMLNDSKLNLKEIQQVWSGIKSLTRHRNDVSYSALEIARESGWEVDKSDVSNRITTAIASLEQVGYVKRSFNSPRVYADSILVKSIIEANERIDKSNMFAEKEVMNAKRVMQLLITEKNIKSSDVDIAESRVDYIADLLGLTTEEVIGIVRKLREINVLRDDKDLVAEIVDGTTHIGPIRKVRLYEKIINHLFNLFTTERALYNVKNIYQQLDENNVKCELKDVKRAISYLDRANIIDVDKQSRDNFIIKLYEEGEAYLDKFSKQTIVNEFIIEYLYNVKEKIVEKNKNMVYFSIMELVKEFNRRNQLLQFKVNMKDIEDRLFYLQNIKVLQIEGGFFVLYHRLDITKTELNPRKMFTKEDYQNLETFYENRKQQIHIVGEFANIMYENKEKALELVQDYFLMNYQEFIKKYFPGEKKEQLNLNMSVIRFNELFSELTDEQLAVIKDKDNETIAVAAGPGSGKTRVLVHKLVSILYNEDIRSEQLLMLTFSRVAATDFKEKLADLIGSSAYYINIRTFHSFAFDVLGKVGNLMETDSVIKAATEKIKSREVEPAIATKMILVIDEAQDMNVEEYELVKALIDYNENLRVVAVGDDDQNIFEFRGADSKYFRMFAEKDKAFYELGINFRAKKNLIDFSNKVASLIKNRLKKKEIRPHRKELGHIKVTKYNGQRFIMPFIEDILNSKLRGTTAILTLTNEEALQITGILNKKERRAELIQATDNVKAFNVYEIREFYNLLEYKAKNLNTQITDKIWIETFKNFAGRYKTVKDYELYRKILNKFKQTAGVDVFISDFKEYLLETNLDDFYIEAPFVVSTLHKAKGKEFNNVFIYYDSTEYLEDADLRVLYVGITRAKDNLNIHTNHKIFNYVDRIENLRIVEYDKEIKEPMRFVYRLGYSDVFLGYFEFSRYNVRKALPGDELKIENGYVTHDGKKVVQFSKKAKDLIKSREDLEYKITSISANQIVYWYNREKEEEYLALFPEIVFGKDE